MNPLDQTPTIRALLSTGLRRALSYIDKPSTPVVNTTANAEENVGVSKPSLFRTYTGLGSAKKERRKTTGTGINLDTIAKAIRSAGTGAMMDLTDLSRETIDMDPHLASVLQKRFGALSSLPWEVQVAEGAGVDKDKALYYAMVVRDQLRKLPHFRRNLNQLAWGIFDGRAALELDWRSATTPLIDRRFGRVSIVLGSMSWVHPRLLSFGERRQLIIIDSSTAPKANYSSTGIDLSEEALRKSGNWRKYVSWTPQLFGEYPEKEGLAPRCLNWAFFKRFTTRDMMTLIELFGKPWRIIKVPEESSASAEDIEDSLQTVDSLGATYTALLAKGCDLEITQPGRTAGQIHESIIKEVDSQISKLVLGQTGTTDGVPAGLNSNQAYVMQDEQLLILQNDAFQISEVVERQVTDAIIETNFGAEELIHAPRFVLRSDRPSDRMSELNRLKGALDAGMEIKATEAYEVAGFQMPDKDDRIIRIDQPLMEPGATQTPVPRAMIIDPSDENGTVDELPEENVEEIDEDYEEELAAAKQNPGEHALLASLIGKISPNDAIILSNAAEMTRYAENERSCGCPICCSTEKVEQPKTEFGSPDDLVDKKESELFGYADKWAQQIATAIGDTDKPKEIIKRVRTAVKGLDTKPYAKALRERMAHGTILGMLDNALLIGDISAPKSQKSMSWGIDLSFSTLPFKSALKSFLERDIISKEEWKKVDDKIKRKSFTIAGIETQTMRQKIFAILAKEIDDGADLRGFRKTMIAGLQAAGLISSVPESGLLSASHIDTVFRTNVLNAYNFGRAEHASQPSVIERFPVWEIRAIRDDRTRETHLAANGICLRADDPFWQTAYPPWDFSCRCRVIPRSKEYLSKVVSGSTVQGLPGPGFVSGYGKLI